MKPYRSIVAILLLVLSAGCATTPQFKKVSTEEAFSAIRELAEDKSPARPELEVIDTHLYTQPLNKSVPCKLPTSQDQLDRKNFRAYWDGDCKGGFAYGLGRDIAISDTHHVEEITIYEDNGKASSRVHYDFVEQFVGYSSDEYDGSQIRLVEQYINNEGEDFNIMYRQNASLKNGNSYGKLWSPFHIKILEFSIIENVVYEYMSSRIKPINNRAAVLHFQTIDNKTGSPIGYEITKYANGYVNHVDLNNAERVRLPEEYLSMVGEKYHELSESNSRVQQNIQAVRRMEAMYLNQACNGEHEISGLEKNISNKICTWRNQFKEPFELAKNRFDESLERMKAEAQKQLEQQRIQEQLNYEKRMAEAAKRKKESESVNALQMLNLFSDSLNAFADGLNGTSNAYRYRPPTSSYNSYTPSNAPSGYRSSMGSRYQYDLSKPLDRLRYRIDPKAKLRDRLDVNPQRRIERLKREYGGGVLRNNRGAQW
tara:strand:- start:81 stop:1532 length:1452 start_codon:yes stop_codon:yes gene_type:complete